MELDTMAAHYLFYEQLDDFIAALEQHEPTLVRKMVKCVLSAISKKSKEVVVFEATFRDSSTETVTIYEKNYLKVLTNMLQYLIRTDEDWLLCADVRDAIEKLNKPKRTRKKKDVTV